MYLQYINVTVLHQVFNDDKRLQSFNGVKSYPYETSDNKVCKEELLRRVKTKNLITNHY